MIGSVCEYVATISEATHGSMTVEQILDMPVAQGLQLRSAGLIAKNVRMKPAGGSNLRREAESILGDYYEEFAS